MNDIILIIFGIVLSILIVRAIIYVRDLEQQHKIEIAKLMADHETELRKNKDKQRSVIKGQLAEQLYPVSEHCPYLLSDMKFMGMPIDYIIFDGYTDAKDGDGRVKEVIFAEIKTGSSRLSHHQREIKQAILDGRVRWETINL